MCTFAGPFDAEDAAAVTDLETRAAVDVLDRLTERSLVLRTPDERWVVLETVRAFGADRLASSGRLPIVGGRHARHQLARARRLSDALMTPAGASLAHFDAAVPELRIALRWAIDRGEIELSGHIVTSVFDYAFLRMRPDVYAWSELVLAADPDDTSPVAESVWAAAGYAAWMAGDIARMSRCSDRAAGIAGRHGRRPAADVVEIMATCALIGGRVTEAAECYRLAAQVAAAAGQEVLRITSAASELLALGYAGEHGVEAAAATLLDSLGAEATPRAAYAWYCAGEADVAIGADLARARARLERARQLADATHATLPAGLAGATLASIEARWGDAAAAAADYRRLLVQWRRAGMWSTQWTMLRSIAVLLGRLGRDHAAAVLVGAVRSTDEGHAIFGADEVALTELSEQLGERLGRDACDAAMREGARLDGAATVEHALRSL